VLAAVGFGAVVVTSETLDASDRAAARAEAARRLDDLERELAEGDTAEEAAKEVEASATAAGTRLRVVVAGAEVVATDKGMLSTLSRSPLAQACTNPQDEAGRPFEACAASDGRAWVAAAIPVGAHRAAVGTLLRGMLLVVALGLFALWVAVRRALRGPLLELRSLVAWAERIIATEHPIDPPPADTSEIVSLERAFDSVVRRLLEALARARVNSAHIAHELRTPLTSILAELDALAPGEAVARIRGDVRRLTDVIDALLVLSDPRDPGRTDALVNVADLARDMAPERAEVRAPDEALIEADEHLVALALRNLLENAQRYASGARAVLVSRDGPRLRLAVRDEGPGLDAEARARMFDRHWRASAEGPGRGLGLALVLAVAERYGGSAEATPGPAGRGLEVAMTFDGIVRWQDETVDRR
jgi:signal transduction histidine kinase